MEEERVTAATEAQPTPIGTKAVGCGLALSALVGLAAWLPRAAESPTIQFTLWGTALAGALGSIALRQRALTLEVAIRKHHVVQFLMHSTIFIYWATAITEVVDQFVLIGIQFLIGYLLDFLLSWWRRGHWSLGFGPLPVIGSINLFLWFKDDWWYLQLLMLILAFGSKPFLRWTRDGRDTHIFNPSAISLAALSLSVLLAGQTDITWGQTIATSLNAPTYMFEVIFAVGIAVQLLFDTTLVTAGAALTVWIIGIIYYQLTGWWFFNDTHIPIAVFLGMNLLITDPTTSPKNKVGRLLFGATYGLAVFPLWSGLQAFGRPTFYDKLLQVPLLNLLVPAFERLGVWITERTPKLKWVDDNRLHVAIWLVLFIVLRPGLIDHPGKAVSHGHMFAHGVGGVTKDLGKAAALFRKSCYRGVPLGCFELGVLHLNGAGVTQDPEKAASLFRTACDGGEAGACVELGRMHYEGVGATKDPKSAAQLYERACEASEANGCANLALMYQDGTGVPQDKERSRALLQQACTLEHSGACGLLQQGGAQATGPPGGADAACRAGRGDACAMLYALEEQKGTPDARRMIELLERGCAANHFPSCNVLGGRYAMGRDVAPNPKRAAELAQKACAGGLFDACGNLAGMYLEGRGVPRDLERARALLNRACTGGIPRACEFLKRLPPSAR